MTTSNVRAVILFVLLAVTAVFGIVNLKLQIANADLQQKIDSLRHRHGALVDSSFTNIYRTDSIQNLLIHDIYEQLNGRK